MDTKKIIIIASILLIIVIVLFVNILKKDKPIEALKQIETLDVESSKSIEEDIKVSVEECKKKYIEYGTQNFDIYFKDEFINENMTMARVTFINDTSNINSDYMEIYDSEGKKVYNFPDKYLDGKAIEYDNNIYQIQPEKNYLIKVYSYENSYFYYYILKFDRSGNSTLRQVGYTIGEVEGTGYDTDILIEE